MCRQIVFEHVCIRKCVFALFTHYFMPLSVFLQCHLNNTYCHVEFYCFQLIFTDFLLFDPNINLDITQLYLHTVRVISGETRQTVYISNTYNPTPFVCNLNQCFKLHNMPIHWCMISLCL